MQRSLRNVHYLCVLVICFCNVWHLDEEYCTVIWMVDIICSTFICIVILYYVKYSTLM